MTDLLVDLRKIAWAPIVIPEVTIARVLMEEMGLLKKFIMEEFEKDWWVEIRNGLRSYNEVSVFIAVEPSLGGAAVLHRREEVGNNLGSSKIVGFAAYEVTHPGFFGPIGVTDQGKGIGKSLLRECLLGLQNLGYVYGIIHDVGDSIGFYEKALGKNLIEIEV